MESRGKRPFKIWDGFRNIRKSLVVSSLKDLEIRGKEKLNIAQNESVRLVLETDGTQIEDSEYFKTLPNNTTVLLLKDDEYWYPSGVDAIKTAIAAIPKIVCETIHALELQDATPSWKIMDNKGRITVVLHWDHQRNMNYRGGGGGGGVGGGGGSGGGGSGLDSSPSKRTTYFHSGGFGIGGLLMENNANKRESDQSTMQYHLHQQSEPLLPPPIYRHGSMPQITVIHHDALPSTSMTNRLGQNNQAQQQHVSRMSKQGNSSMDTAAIHVHTSECSHHGILTPPPPLHHSGSTGGTSSAGGGSSSRASSPARDSLLAAATAASGYGPTPPPVSDNGFECDFHCCTLHEEGRRIAVHKSVATSPIQECRHSPPPPPLTVIQPVSSSLSDGTRRGSPKGHVRFLDANMSPPIPPPPLLLPSPPNSPVIRQPQPDNLQQPTTSGASSSRKQSSSQQQQQQSRSDESSDTETETTVIEEESMTSEKFLLLIDQLTTAQNKHLSVKDIGIILERLNSKIVDVERLDRDYEATDCYNWTIKATIKGNVLQEVGIIYNGNYYGISEHPGYNQNGELINEYDEEVLEHDDISGGVVGEEARGAAAAIRDDRHRRRAEEEVNI
ncbi:CIDE-N domain [Cinara cedri]|uniref:CIDE-N domain n=1 Tax=Cinara cedri TaxID=506608 RepID=A0A5E4NTH8_9HEMI|nr:CIDE-N domain [Cinara cedri]